MTWLFLAVCLLFPPATTLPRGTNRFYGYVVKIEYKDGAAEWICGTNMTYYIDADGQSKTDHYTPDIDSWNAAILPYLPQKGA